jgi:hypothetical protein
MTLREAEIYAASEEVVVREIEGELIIVPLTGGLGDAEQDALYTLNATGRAVWAKIDGRRTVREIVDELSGEFDARPGEIDADVAGLIEELAARRMLRAVT